MRLLLYYTLGILLGMTIGMRCHAYGLLDNVNDEQQQPQERSFKLFEADRLDLEYRKVAVHRDPFYVEDTDSFRYGASVLFDVRALKYLYWRNNVHMMATDSQVRAVGWEFEWGANVTKYFDVFYYHHSMHVLERERPTRNYPLVNEYGIRMHFLTKP